MHGIGLTALGEIRRHRSIHLHHLDVRMRSGETVRVSAVERAEIEALAAALGARLSPGH